MSDNRVVALCAVLLAVLFAGCSKTVYVPQTRTEYVNRERVDSVYLRDSIYVTLRTANDTVYVTQYRDRIRDKVSIRTDTVCRVDSIPYPVPSPPEIVYQTPKATRWLAWIGGIALLALVIKLWARFGIR